jgi:uncharacterized protein (DUF433 family)
MPGPPTPQSVPSRVKLNNMKLPPRIEAKPEVMVAKPCVQGTRIPVHLTLQKWAASEGTDELLAAYPQLTQQDLPACLEYAEATCR